MVTMAEHRGFQALQVLRVRLEIALDIGGDGLAFPRQFEESVEVVGHAADPIVVGDGLLQALAGLHHFLALFGLIPKIRRGDLRLAFG